MKAKKVSISIPEDIHAWLQRAAKKRRVTVSYMVREALLPKFNARHAK